MRIPTSSASVARVCATAPLQAVPELCPSQGILLDPSCSGSGTLEDARGVSRERLGRLASFQRLALRRALTEFPRARVVVYSTCSVFPEVCACGLRVPLGVGEGAG
jgi:16S rRNA C967 or C1407 C5-methylase (RsmB/RsmF family)